MKKIIFSFILGCLVLSSCRDYVEIDAIGQRTLKYTDDYQYLLNYDNFISQAFYYTELASDEVDISDEGFQTRMSTKDAAVYTWADYIYSDTEEDNDWTKLYKEIYICNQVIEGVMDSEKGTEKEKANIYAQAQVHRAFAYLDLVNVFAKQYDKETASTDEGVPLLLTPDLYASLKRASVQEVYDQIQKDLKEAMLILPDAQSNAYNASKISAYGVMARTCLQMGEYDAAYAYADSVLQKKNTLLDLNDYINNKTSFPKKMYNPEVVLYKTLSNLGPVLPLSNHLLGLLGEKDLRYQLFTVPGTNFSWNSFNGRGYSGYQLTYDGVYTGPCVPEMMLIKAEVLARNGNYTDAISLVNDLRKKRFAPADYTDLTATSKEEALQTVIDERQREFFGRGFRWYDQKRLNKEAALAQTVTRTFKGETYTLAPNDNHYVFPIANKYIILNPEITQNPR
ncbi:MAG: RagB/SusD family nutrient uptake outer membrane protein [Bacteroides sp.]|jgi:hypothetical protein|nr:RagB/SusD family nutrient uptake outer membrane protein [Bacteroides sp.]